MQISRLLAMATVLSLSLSGAASAQSSGAGAMPNGGNSAPQGPAPRLERGIDSQGMERGTTGGPLERNTREGLETPRDMTNPQQTPSSEPAASESRVRNMLEKQGYANVQNIQRVGDAYTATATKGSETVNIRIDPQLGQIEEHGG
jgi:hypothetical protein